MPSSRTRLKKDFSGNPIVKIVNTDFSTRCNVALAQINAGNNDFPLLGSDALHAVKSKKNYPENSYANSIFMNNPLVYVAELFRKKGQFKNATTDSPKEQWISIIYSPPGTGKSFFSQRLNEAVVEESIHEYFKG